MRVVLIGASSLAVQFSASAEAGSSRCAGEHPRSMVFGFSTITSTKHFEASSR